MHSIKLINNILIEKTNNLFDIPKLNCLLFNSNLENEFNNQIDFCNNCFGNICKDCSTLNLNNNPKHLVKISLSHIIFKDFYL